jgi:DNA-binding SARP family transcriptional activator
VLEDLHGFQFVDPFATALTEDKLYVHTARAEAEIVCGRWYAVIAELQGLIIEHPYHEPLWAQLIAAYYLSERQSDALDAYGRLKAILADDLGIDPGPTVQELQARILRQEPLDVKKAAQRTAARAVTSLQQDDASVSRHHAVVIDTGTNWVITDLRSANGVKLRQQRIRGTATLADGDRIGIGGHELTFEIPPPETELPDSV